MEPAWSSHFVRLSCASLDAFFFFYCCMCNVYGKSRKKKTACDVHANLRTSRSQEAWALFSQIFKRLLGIKKKKKKHQDGTPPQGVKSQVGRGAWLDVFQGVSQASSATPNISERTSMRLIASWKSGVPILLSPRLTSYRFSKSHTRGEWNSGDFGKSCAHKRAPCKFHIFDIIYKSLVREPLGIVGSLFRDEIVEDGWMRRL